MEYTKKCLVKYRIDGSYKPCYHTRTFTITIQTDEFGFWTRRTYTKVLDDLTECIRKQENTDKITILWYEVKRG